MFLTRIRLNPKRAKTRALLDNRYIGHALVESCTCLLYTSDAADDIALV